VLYIGNTKDFHIAPGAEQGFSPRSGSYGEIREQAEKTLEEAHLRMGDPDDEILRFCEEQGDVGLLVMGSDVRHAHCPSWWRAASNAGR
jgi:hypothetical protein